MASGHPMGRAEIAQTQLARLRELLRAVFESNQFYREKFTRNGNSNSVSSLANFAASFPFTTKSELVADQAAHPPFGSNLTSALEDYCHFHQTSGTTGAPLRWLDTAESWRNMVECWMEVFRAAGVTSKDRIFFA